MVPRLQLPRGGVSTGRTTPSGIHIPSMKRPTPSCTAPFSISRRTNKDGTEAVSLALRPLQPNSNHMLFLSKLDEKIVKWAHANQQEMFGTTGKSMEVIADKYYPCVKNKNANYDPFFETKLKFKDGVPGFKLTDAENNEIETIEKGSTITAVVAYPSLWLSNTGFGLNGKLVNAVIKPPMQSRIASYAIVDEI